MPDTTAEIPLQKLLGLAWRALAGCRASPVLRPKTGNARLCPSVDEWRQRVYTYLHID